MSNTYVSDIRNTLYRKLITEEYVTDKTGVKTLEIMNASFIADQPSIIGNVNEDYVERELAWYKSQSLNVNDIPGETPAIWKAVATEDGYINSNYGWCIYSEENGYQFENVVDELTKNPYSRRANMIYTRPSMHSDYNRDGMSDFMCTNNVQYIIRDDQVHALVYMRSNDAVFGYKNDWAWQKHVLNEVASEICVQAGDLYWNVSSLHVYERHFNLLKDAVYRS
jgi:thymidylate synthase